MRLHRFYINTEIKEGGDIKVEDTELLHQWMKVFRFKITDNVIIFNGDGFDYSAVFEELTKKSASLHILEKKKILNAPKLELTILQSIIKKDNFEMIVQKGTEIGVSNFVPVISERSEKKNLNIERLQKIAKEATEQSGRGRLPEISAPTSLEQAISDFHGTLFVLDFDGAPLSATEISGPKSVGILVGPEGGWSKDEREYFKKNNVKSVSLGCPVLRAETASIAVASLILLS